MTPNVADHNVTTPKIAPGAVSLTGELVEGPNVVVPALGNQGASASCPAGTVLISGGYEGQQGLDVWGSNPSHVPGANEWGVGVYNPTSSPLNLNAVAYCATIHP